MKTSNKSKPLVVIQCYEDRQQTLPLRKAESAPLPISSNNNHLPAKKDAPDHPPPPPPMPTANGISNGDHKTVHNEKPKMKDLNIRNGTLKRTPTPDYNNKTETTVPLKLNGNVINGNGVAKDEKAELESIDSYKLKNPMNGNPKPPSNYFMKAPNGTATMKKLARPVSVTIGEYTSGGGNRREPSKLDFLNGDSSSDVADDVPITNRLQSELAMTLSRSNLRKKTEAMGDAAR